MQSATLLAAAAMLKTIFHRGGVQLDGSCSSTSARLIL